MTRDELEHLIRAAGELVDDDLVVIGSQAILGSHPDPPNDLLRSMEADIYPLNYTDERSDAIDGALGDGSIFKDTYGYWAHAVAPSTPIAPAGWQQRLIPIQAPTAVYARHPRRGHCMEPHDLVLAKLAAGRPRDIDFALICLTTATVNTETLRSRCDTIPPTHRDAVRARLEGVISQTLPDG